MKTAIILGATGLTGGYLLQKLLKDSRYGKIVLFSRHAAAVRDEKIEEHLVELLNLKEQKERFKADEVFCCIGTTKSKTPNKKDYVKVDLGIPATAAKICKENGIETFAVISALGADSESKIFYNKVKGEMEEEVLAQRVKNTYIFQPSLIAGDREEKRLMETFAKYVMKIVNPFFVGPLKKYQSIHPEKIATAMVYVANNGYEKSRIKSDEIEKVSKMANKKEVA